MHGSQRSLKKPMSYKNNFSFFDLSTILPSLKLNNIFILLFFSLEFVEFNNYFVMITHKEV